MTELEKSTRQKESDSDQAIESFAQLFLAPEVKDKAHHRCGIGGPTELNVVF